MIFKCYTAKLAKTKWVDLNKKDECPNAIIAIMEGAIQATSIRLQKSQYIYKVMS